jgi:hypothetical protein
MAVVVYLLCAVTSLCCAILLLRSYLNNRTPLLFWSSLCFLGLAINNVLVFVDLVVVPTVDLSKLRAISAVVAIGLLVFGLVWEASD